MRNKLKILPVAALLLVVWGFVTAAQNNPGTAVRASLDSAYLLMGRVTPLHVTVVTASPGKGEIVVPQDSLTAFVEVHYTTDPVVTDLGNGRVQIDRDVVIQSFDSGNYLIPAIKYIDGKDTFLSNTLALKVIPVNVDTLATIHDFAPVMTITPHFWDFLPDWIVDYLWWWIGAMIFVVACVAIAVYMLWRRSHAKPVIPKPRPRPVNPYAVAMRQLRQLRDEELWEKGQDKEFYTRLTDILRDYIDTRFHINAREMTSEQILSALRHNEATRLSEAYMRRILEIADYVKFARMKPFSDDNRQAFNGAMQFVEDTKPVPPTPPSGAQGRPAAITSTKKS